MDLLCVARPSRSTARHSSAAGRRRRRGIRRTDQSRPDQFAHRDAEIGIWLDSRLHGRGLATAAVALVADYVLVDLDLLHRLTAPVAVDNAAAAATFRRLGFTPEGTMRSYLDVGGRRRDHDLWAILRPDIATRLGDAARTPH